MPSINRFRRAEGFTLIEVLVAALILFLFLSLAAQAFSQSAESSRRAERTAKVSAMVPLVVENIKGQIQAAEGVEFVQGTGGMLDVEYQWQAQLVLRKAPPPRFDPSEMEFKTYEERFNLWEVTLKVNLGSYQREWIYEEISWY